MTDFSRFKLNALTPAIGAELLDCDLTKIDATLVEEVRAALLQHRVVFFRDQELTREQHIEFAAQFGNWKFIPQRPKTKPTQRFCALPMGPSRAAQKTCGTQT